MNVTDIQPGTKVRVGLDPENLSEVEVISTHATTAGTVVVIKTFGAPITAVTVPAVAADMDAEKALTYAVLDTRNRLRFMSRAGTEIADWIANEALFDTYAYADHREGEGKQKVEPPIDAQMEIMRRAYLRSVGEVDDLYDYLDAAVAPLSCVSSAIAEVIDGED